MTNAVAIEKATKANDPPITEPAALEAIWEARMKR